MKRKIAAIFAADIAGYSRLVAEDEEETLRRLASYRAGDRRFHRQRRRPHLQHRRRCRARRISERRRSGALRDRHPGKPAHAQHGVSAEPADGVSHRHHDRRRGRARRRSAGRRRQHRGAPGGLAEVGGICVSRAVHEQVANKLSVQFADIGAQEVKNIPTPVHAYMVAMRREDGTYATPQVKKPAKPRRQCAELDVAGCGHGGLSSPRSASAASCISPSWRRRAGRRPQSREHHATSAPAPHRLLPAVSADASADASRSQRDTAATVTSPPIVSSEKFAAETMPFVSDRTRAALASEYAAGGRLQGVRRQHQRHSTPSSSGSRAKRPPRRPRSSSARSARMPLSRRANAKSMRSAIPWSIRMASRRCRRCPGSGTIRRPSGRSSAKDVPLVRDTGKSEARKRFMRRAGRPRRSRSVPAGSSSSISALEAVEDAGAAKSRNPAARSPAFPA